MVKLEPKQQPRVSKVGKPKPTKTAMVFLNPIFEGIVAKKEKDSRTSFVVSEWTVKLRVGHFYETSKEQEVTKQYEPLVEGQTVKSLTVVPSGKYFNLVNFDLGSGEEPQSSSLHPSYLVCLIDDVYPIDENSFKELKKANKVSKNKVKLEELKESLLNFRFSNGLDLTFKQIGCGYHFLPVSYILKLFKAGFEQFCTVVGLIYPNGKFVKFEKRPTNYQTLIEKLKEVGVYVGSKIS